MSGFDGSREMSVSAAQAKVYSLDAKILRSKFLSKHFVDTDFPTHER